MVTREDTGQSFSLFFTWSSVSFTKSFSACTEQAKLAAIHPSIRPPTHLGKSGRQTGRQATGFYLVKPTQAELFSFPAFPRSLSLFPSSSDVSQVTGEEGEGQHRQQVKAKCTCAHCRLPVAASSLPPSLPGINCCLDVVFPVVVVVLRRGCPPKQKMS